MRATLRASRFSGQSGARVAPGSTPTEPVHNAPARTARHLELLAEFLEAASRADDETDVLQSLAERAAAADGLSCGVAMLRPAGGEFAMVAYHASDPARLASVREHVLGAPLRLDESGFAEVLRTGAAVHVSGRDSALSFRTPGLAGHMAALPVAEQLWAPIRRAGAIVGAVNLNRTDATRPPFDNLDRQFVASLASAASLMLESIAARRSAELDAERERIRADAFMAAARAGDDDHAVLAELVERLAGMGGYAWVQELAADGETVVVSAWHVTDPSLRPEIETLLPARGARADLGTTGSILRTGRPLFIADAAGMADSAFMRDRSRPPAAALVRGVAIVPLRRGGRVIGALGIGHVDPAFRGLEPADVALLESLAATTSILLDNAAARRARDEAAVELARTTALLSAVLDASPFAIVAADAEARVTFWSRAAERLYGWRADEVLGRQPPTVGPDGAPLLRQQMERLRAGEVGIVAEGRRLAKSGQWIDVLVSLVPMRDDRGALAGVLAIQEDLTERRRLEAELAQAQKMETVGRLAGGVAHDFNNILTVIIGHAAIAETTASDPEVRHSLAAIQRSAERAAGLTAQLLAFSRRQLAAPEHVSLSAVLAETEPMLRRLIGEHIQLSVDAGDGVGPVLADRTQIAQVVLNLAVNGRDAMPDGGRLSLSAYRARLHAAPADHPAVGRLAAGDYAVLSVADTGAGIEAATLGRIFEPFFTTKPVGQGTGLGLSTVYGIVTASDGAIEVESAAGSGSTFRVWLPLVQAPAPRLDADRPADEAVAGRPAGRVLLVEDEPLLRDVAKLALERAGFAVTAAGDAAEARRAASAGVGMDLLVSDVVMPSGNGAVLARELRDEHPGLAVVLMSGYANSIEDVRAAADVFLEKPFAPADLVRAARSALARAQG